MSAEAINAAGIDAAAGFVPPEAELTVPQRLGKGPNVAVHVESLADEAPVAPWTVTDIDTSVAEVAEPEQRSLLGRFAGRIATGAAAMRSYVPAVSAALIPGLHYLAEDPAFVVLQNRAMDFMSRFPHGVGSLGATAALGVAMFAESYGAGRWANTAPRVARSYDALEERSNNPVVHLGQTALATVKKPFEWAGNALQSAGGGLEASDNQLVRTIGSVLRRTGLVNALGVPGAAAYRGGRIPREEIAKDAVAFSASWFAGYWALRGIYMGLGAIDHITGHPALTAAARVPMHLISEGFTAISSNPNQLPCQIAIGAVGAITAAMGINAARAVHHQRLEESQSSQATA